MPGQEVVETVHGMAVGHAPENVAEVGIGLDAVEPCRGDEGAGRCPSLSSAIGAGETGSGHVFQVADTGIGIALDDIPKVLAPFQQVDGELSRKYEGTGLGLPLAKSLVELHGGSLDLQSRLGVGATVTVRFPAERVVSSPHDAKALDPADRKAG